MREKAFQCPEGPFLLFPTGYHSNTSLCKPGEALPYQDDDLMWDPKNDVQVPLKGYAVVCTTIHVFLNGIGASSSYVQSMGHICRYKNSLQLTIEMLSRGLTLSTSGQTSS